MLLKGIKYISLISFALLFLPSTAVLVNFYKLVLPNGKNVYLFFEIHRPPSIQDEQQLENFSKILILRDQLQKTPIHLMVEVPPFLCQERESRQKVTYNILEKVAHCPSIIAEDIEIRCIANSSDYLLDLPKRFFEEKPSMFLWFLEKESFLHFNAADDWCILGDITFGMLLNEFKTQNAKICSYLDSIISGKHFYSRKKLSVVGCEAELIAHLKDADVHPDDRIINFVKKMNGNSDQLILVNRLKNIISDYGTHLFDLHILRKILESQHDHCLLIAGAAHSEWICNALEELDAQYEVVEGDRKIPLERQSFNVFRASLGLPASM